jgi:DNA-binding transcriptional LysR family regulator
MLAAAPSYLREHAAPRVPVDLSGHACLVYSSVQGDDRWSFTGPSGEEMSVPVKGPLRSNNLSTVLAACRAGMGLAVLPWYVARESVADGSIEPVLTDHTLPAQELHAVFPSPKLVPSKVTSFIAFAQEALAGEWWKKAL